MSDALAPPLAIVGGKTARNRESAGLHAVALVVSLALHAAILAALAWRGVEIPPGTQTVEVELLAEAEAVDAPAQEHVASAAPQPEAPPTPEATPSPTPAPTTAPEPEPTPTLSPTPTGTPAPSAAPTPTATPTPEPTPTPALSSTPTTTPEPSPTPEPTPSLTPVATPAPAIPSQPPRAAETHKTPAPSRNAVLTRPRAPTAPAAPGVAAEGAAVALGAARADYGAKVRAELKAHMFYPSAARAAGETGVVGVHFVIGASGHAEGLTIARSSGSAALDAAARSIVGSLDLPPPPGGAYPVATGLNFDLQ